MATAVEHFTKLQVGIETTKGTLLAATRIIKGRHAFMENETFYRTPYPSSIRANVGGAGVITGKAFEVDATTELTFEEILWPLMTGVIGSITPTGAGADKTWTFTPELTTNVITAQSLTGECILSDGTTNQYYGEFGYGMTRSFKIDWAVNDVARLAWRLFGRARQTDTPTAGLVVYSGREEAVTNLLKVYMDTTWAGLGTTQLTAIVRSASFECTTGIQPDYTLDGRADLDFTIHKVGPITAKLQMVLEFDANAATRITEFRSNNLRYVRLINTGTIISASNKTVQIDGAYRHASTPRFSVDGDQILVSLDLESVYDATGTATLKFVVINALTAIA